MWNGWPLDRVLLLFTALALLLIFIQVWLFHYRQNFRHWAMWIPVLATPVLGVCLIILALGNTTRFRPVVVALLVAGLLGGLVGFYYHFRGVGTRVDGYRIQNFLVGPPVILPLMVTAISVLGLMAIYWRS